ncbi:MAG: BlaI/MecI/CopY family transcriptional regulator [Xanthomonadales bacterium]|nr:BlaI/MecI/CopY family transcriptional regulator [Xanthomonadales bacterium]
MESNKRALPQPTRTELNILRILWASGPCTVREVHEALNEEESSGYTTALKMLQVMHQKGLVERDDSQRAHVYTAAMTKDETQNEFLADLVDRLFDGSTSQLVLQALGNAPQADQEQLKRIRALLADLED